MDATVETIEQLFRQHFGRSFKVLTKLPQSGSDRIYFRIQDTENSYIATYGLNIKENETFVNFSKHFKNQDLPVPKIYAVTEDYKTYLQEDLGNESLLNKLEQHGHNDYVYGLFCKSLDQLANIQIKGHGGLNYN